MKDIHDTPINEMDIQVASIATSALLRGAIEHNQTLQAVFKDNPEVTEVLQRSIEIVKRSNVEQLEARVYNVLTGKEADD